MVKNLRKILRSWMLGCLCWLLFSSPAWANKVTEPMVFDAGTGAIAVVSLYETSSATQADAVQSFYKLTKSFYKAIPGFYGLVLFSSTDGSRIVELSQWADVASYNACQASLVSGGVDYTKYYEKYSGTKGGNVKAKEAVELGEPFLTTAFAIDQAVSPPGMVSAIQGETALVQIIEIAADSPEQQVGLLTAAQATLADLPQLYPAPRTAVLLKGIDPPHLALLVNWGSAAEFSDLDQMPQLALAADVEALELNLAIDSHLYQAIKVIIPKAKKPWQGTVPS